MQRTIKIHKTSETIPKEGQKVMYMFGPSGNWFIGEFDGEWTFMTYRGFCDGHDAPYWIDYADLPTLEELDRS